MIEQGAEQGVYFINVEAFKLIYTQRNGKAFRTSCETIKKILLLPVEFKTLFFAKSYLNNFS
jgi:hypothetical protein